MFEGTLDLASREAWTNHELVTDHRDAKLAKAERLDREITALVTGTRRNHYELCLRLGVIRDEELWKPLGRRSFVRYALESGAAGSTREARQWADVAGRLPERPALHAVFRSGTTCPSRIREAVLAADPSNDEEWARDVLHMTVDQLKAKGQVKRGEPPTGRISAELPLADKARLLALLPKLAERLGQKVGVAELLAHLIDLGEAECADGEPGAKEPAGVKRLPARPARIHTGTCVSCGTQQVRGPEGWVALSPEVARLLECDAEVQDEHGNVTRRISEQTRRLVFERDGMACAVPSCGATFGLHFHHEGTVGTAQTPSRSPQRTCGRSELGAERLRVQPRARSVGSASPLSRRAMRARLGTLPLPRRLLPSAPDLLVWLTGDCYGGGGPFRAPFGYATSNVLPGDDLWHGPGPPRRTPEAVTP